MYSTSLKNDRYLTRCLVSAKDINMVNFIIDTGARFTCCNYKLVDESMREERLADCEMKLIGGFIKGEYVKFYRYWLKQFTIGNVDMEAQAVWVTFDGRVTDNVLGMDILKQIILITNPYNQKIYFCKNIQDYQQNINLTNFIIG